MQECELPLPIPGPLAALRRPHHPNVLQARDGRLMEASSGKAVTPRFQRLLFVLRLLVFVLAARGAQVEEERLVLLLLQASLPLRLGLGLVVQQQVRVVVAAAVSNHHRADGAGIDVLDLEKTFDHVDVLRLHVLSGKGSQCVWGGGRNDKQTLNGSLCLLNVGRTKRKPKRKGCCGSHQNKKLDLTISRHEYQSYGSAGSLRFYGI